MADDAFDFVFERNYASAAAYYRAHGNLECSPDFIDSAGVKLGAWLGFLRTEYRKCGKKPLSEAQLRLMDGIGMRWGSKRDSRWDANFRCLEAYLSRTQSSDVPVSCKENGVPLGKWLRRQKELFTAGKLDAGRARQLQALGISLTLEDPWEAKFRLAQAYSEKHGNLNVPADYVEAGVWLHKWLSEQRLMGEGKRKKRLTPDQRGRLESIGMTFGQTHAEQVWEAHYQALRALVERTGSTEIPEGFHDGRANLKAWLARQIVQYKKGLLPQDHAEKLRALGVYPDDNTFETGFSHAEAYYRTHGNLHVRKEDSTEDFDLAGWVGMMRQRKRRGRLQPEQIRRLESIGMFWDGIDDAWNEMFEAARAFAKAGAPLRIPIHAHAPNGHDLHGWYARQRRSFRAGKLTQARAEKLLSIGAQLHSDQPDQANDRTEIE